MNPTDQSGLATTLDLSGRRVGPGEPCYIIAEAGSNHDGVLAQAHSLIDAAAAAGCDAVKFQVFRPEELVSRTAPHAAYLRGMIGVEGTIFDLFTSMAIDRSWLPGLAAHARARSIHFLATPFDTEAVDTLVGEDVNVPALKNASAELWHLPLLRHAAETGRPLIISTGMADLDDVRDAVETAIAAGSKSLALLHCTVRYPAPAEGMNLRALTVLRETFGVPVGLSDHSEGGWAPIAAVTLGASIVEKHFTLSRKLRGPDHAFAMEPNELRDLVGAIRATEEGLGDGRKVRRECEEEIYAISRRNLVASTNLRRGDVLREHDLAILRSQLGLAPKHKAAAIGRRLVRDVPAGHPITWDDLEGTTPLVGQSTKASSTEGEMGSSP